MKKLLIAALAFSVLSIPAQAGNSILFSPQKGDLTFPITPPGNGAPGTLDNTDLGQTTQGKVGASQLKVDSGTKTAVATGTTTATATLNKGAGVITSAALTTAAAGVYTLTLTDSAIAATDQVMASVGNGTNTTGTPDVTTVTPAAGSVVIQVQNIHPSAAFNGTITIAFVTHKN